MGTVLGVAWSLILTAGGVTAAAAGPYGSNGAAGQYLAGHVLVGVGIGQLAALLLRTAFRAALRRLAARGLADRTFVFPADRPDAFPGATAAAVAMLPVRDSGSMARLRGRHAA